MTKKQRHHVYPKKWRHKGNGTTEVKMVKGKEHSLFHQLVADRHPADAIRYIVDNFLPSNIQVIIREV